MQHQPPAFINMQIPQVTQMQATATQMHAHSYPVQSSSHVQAPYSYPVQSSSHVQASYSYGQSVDEMPQIKADQVWLWVELTSISFTVQVKLKSVKQIELIWLVEIESHCQCEHSLSKRLRYILCASKCTITLM